MYPNTLNICQCILILWISANISNFEYLPTYPNTLNICQRILMLWISSNVSYSSSVSPRWGWSPPWSSLLTSAPGSTWPHVLGQPPFLPSSRWASHGNILATSWQHLGNNLVKTSSPRVQPTPCHLWLWALACTTWLFSPLPPTCSFSSQSPWALLSSGDLLLKASAFSSRCLSSLLLLFQKDSAGACRVLWFLNSPPERLVGCHLREKSG